MNIYVDLRTASILEIGAQDVNGSLREHALPSTRYVGIDFEEGDGVDLIAEPGKPLPLDDDSFDLVLASSVFEHDPCFWMTFLEMCRVTKEGGYIYINAPSNGLVHRYPMDNWRFYPDSGKALIQWATAQGQNVTLVESFIADRDQHMWNDFVAVMRKGRITQPLPSVFLHQQVPSSNVITWKSKEILRPKEEPQDMTMLREARERIEGIHGQLIESENLKVALGDENAALNVRLADAEEKNRQQLEENQALERRFAEIEVIRGDLILRESELRQRQEEIEQTRAELSRMLSERDKWKDAFEQVQAQATEKDARLANFADLEGNLAKSVAMIDDIEAQLAEQAAEIEKLRHELHERRTAGEEVARALLSKEAELSAARKDAESSERMNEGKLAQRYQELTTLTRLLRQQERESEQSHDKADWLLSLNRKLANRPRWWALMPRSWERRRVLTQLQLSGLFDGEEYLRRNPDVAAEGWDPLEHYLRHGISEGRSPGQ